LNFSFDFLETSQTYLSSKSSWFIIDYGTR